MGDQLLQVLPRHLALMVSKQTDIEWIILLSNTRMCKSKPRDIRRDCGEALTSPVIQVSRPVLIDKDVGV